MTAVEYIEEREGGLYLAGTRVSLASIVFAFRDGTSPESIRDNFPTLALAQVYGAIAFYLSHQDECEDYLKRLASLWETIERQSQPPSREVQERIEQARLRLLSGNS